MARWRRPLIIHVPSAKKEPKLTEVENTKLPSLKVGMSKKVSFRVEERHLALTVGSGDTRVFSTPMLSAGIEMAAAQLAKPCLEPGQTTVGVHMDIYHQVASPPGMLITFEATLEEIGSYGRRLVYTVRAWDEGGQIGLGVHERAVVNEAKFQENAEARLKKRA